MIRGRGIACDAPYGRTLVGDLDLHVPEGGNLLVTGPSGAGKSRLLKMIAGVERPRSGEVRIAGIAVWPGDGALALAGRVRLGFAFAGGGLLSNLSLEDNTALPLRFLGLPGAEVARRTRGALERLGLEAVARLRPHAVSAAARKHANLARVLALDPEVLLLDDPLENLDAADRALALELIAGWASDPGCTLVLAAEEGPVLPGLGISRLDLPPMSRSPELP